MQTSPLTTRTFNAVHLEPTQIVRGSPVTRPHSLSPLLLAARNRARHWATPQASSHGLTNVCRRIAPVRSRCDHFEASRHEHPMQASHMHDHAPSHPRCWSAQPPARCCRQACRRHLQRRHAGSSLHPRRALHMHCARYLMARRVWPGRAGRPLLCRRKRPRQCRPRSCAGPAASAFISHASSDRSTNSYALSGGVFAINVSRSVP